MKDNVKVSIYGDSLMRGTVIDEGKRYHSTIAQQLVRLAGHFGLDFCNRARFGVTIGRGREMLERDLKKGLGSQYALVEYGGNDCSFAWDEVAADPTANHQPLTSPDAFRHTLEAMVGQLKDAEVTPVLMTLPPIDAERHLNFIGKDEHARKNILAWLGDVQMIYRFHEMYSSVVSEVARYTETILVDVRRRFLTRHDLKNLVGMDGVHPSAEGYNVVSAAFADFIKAHRQAPGGLVYA